MTIQLPPLPNPDIVVGLGHSDDQLRTAQREAALMALEEAANVAKSTASQPSSLWEPGCWAHVSEYIAAQIRALRTELENTK